jgi:hypothetical protein
MGTAPTVGWLCEDHAVDYDLTRLGDREFEHLSQALALQVLGPGVSVFGAGPDGGREAAFEGRMHFPEPDQPWDGYGVVQAKFKQRPAGDGKDAAWFLRQLQAELETWADPKSNRVRRGRVPQYVPFTTNVVLSAAAGSGGVDRVEALVARYADRLRLKGWRVWHHDRLCRLCRSGPGRDGRRHAIDRRGVRPKAGGSKRQVVRRQLVRLWSSVGPVRSSPARTLAYSNPGELRVRVAGLARAAGWTS